MTNAEIAAALDELGVLYELDGAVKYRVLAYSTAAQAIRESPVSVADLAAAGRATLKRLRPERPKPEAHRAYDEPYRRFQALYPALKSVG